VETQHKASDTTLTSSFPSYFPRRFPGDEISSRFPRPAFRYPLQRLCFAKIKHQRLKCHLTESIFILTVEMSETLFVFHGQLTSKN
jgi:hypothetical protein